MRPVLFWISFSLVTSQSFGQPFREIMPVTVDVTEIKQINFNGLFRNGWRSIKSYHQGELVRHRSYFKSELRADDSYAYASGENWKTKKHIYDDEKGFSIDKTYYTSEGVIEKAEFFFDEDTLHPATVWRKLTYKDGNLQSCLATHYGKFRNWTICYEYTYHEGKISSVLTYDSCAELTDSLTITYNSKGYPAYQIIRQYDPRIVVAGGRSENGFQRFYYKFDKRGNWVKRYYVTSSGRRIKEIKRKIEYQ